jgi:3-hydroxyisobutyrate dehydrogenase
MFIQALEGGAMYAPYVGLKGGAMLQGQFEPSFTVEGGAKDLGLALEALRAAGVDSADVAVLAAAGAELDRAVADGHGGLDIAAVYLSHPRGGA